jgi:hypothetical protein
MKNLNISLNFLEKKGNMQEIFAFVQKNSPKQMFKLVHGSTKS